MRFLNVITLLAAFFLSSCQTRHYDEIDMDEALDKDMMSDGAALFGDVEVIELSDTSEMRLGPTPRIVTVMADEIVISNNNDIYHLSRKGEYLNKIGEYGNGHAEHGQILSVSCDTTDRKVYVSTLSSDVYVYTFDGTFVSKRKMKIAGDEKIKSTCYSQKHGLMAELRQYDDAEYKIIIATSNAAGDIVNRELVYSDNLKFDVSRESTSEMYCYGDGIKIKLEYSGVLFCVGDDNNEPVELTCSSRVPNRRMVEDASMKNQLINDYVQVLDVRETNKHLYLVLYKDRNMRCAVYDKQSRRFVFSQGSLNPKRGGGIVLRDAKKKFWPTWTGGNISASVILPGYGEGAENDARHDKYEKATIIVAHE